MIAVLLKQPKRGSGESSERPLCLERLACLSDSVSDVFADCLDRSAERVQTVWAPDKLRVSREQVSQLVTMRLRHAVGLAAVLRVALLAWGSYQDAHSPVPYTDVDYYVFSDAAACILNPAKPLCSPAKGPWGPIARLGDPYSRATYRYTPLVALLLVPNEWVHPAFGKVLFALADLVVGCLLYRLLVRRRKDVATAASSSYAANAVAAIWLLNPIIANISTRGSSESIVGAVVVSTLALADRGRWDAAAALFGLAVHVKIFPFMYGSSLIAAIVGTRTARPTRAVIGRLVRFGAISFASFMTLNTACYLLCVLGFINSHGLRSRRETETPLASFCSRLARDSFGRPFVQETFLYHLSRLDHRHNFSPYFYPYYLAHSPAAVAAAELPSSPSWLRSLARHPLASFLPQLVLSIGLGFRYGAEDLPYAWLVQTFAFVTFNKVCTSQVRGPRPSRPFLLRRRD